ncbi:EmrA/EmrK family multidrug efflux transporter periplasmic adaptor subunit [Denitratisoma sp. DHT3]|uniref:HlyD family secretion protein n=1 Tax=Denitratisoma sp. DHT3 TaxID=1981880 RepID=UPI0011989CDC|nr:efflux RND transporter periplasmic adaptor subunit [Denitratisoma sp. DHT3]QDX81676.1 EmrA/EmrK family multidrug efflux transporter periplasmic adaptor subunit [Denitratisoma sp. DHT3]
MSEATPIENGNDKRRARALKLLALLFAGAGIAYGAYWAFHSRFHETTDDAYVAGNVVQVTPQVAGAVSAIYVEDTDFVQAGAPLVKLDQADTRLALEQAEAELARAVRDARALFANDAGFAALAVQREIDLARRKEDLARRQGLAASGAVSKEEVDHAATAVKAAEAALTTAREQFTANRAQTSGTTVASHPNVARAAARFKEAFLAQARTTILAPVTGHVAKRAVQAGQRIAPGTPLMAVVPLDALWVDANFKEVQLKHMRIGQPVALHADLYGGGVEYRGRIVGLGAGTGAAFALLPAQNATGNWIKVVQRVPVRISLDPKQVAEHPLRVGLSMLADVDTHDRGGKPVTEAQRDKPLVVSEVYGDPLKTAETRLKAIIAANLAEPARY